MASKRFVGEVVELDRDCELGQGGERAVVVKLESARWAEATYMTLCFFGRAPASRKVETGADYLFLRSC
jgi:hypothetical protein